jgi:hypothetical protein
MILGDIKLEMGEWENSIRYTATVNELAVATAARALGEWLATTEERLIIAALANRDNELVLRLREACDSVLTTRCEALNIALPEDFTEPVGIEVSPCCGCGCRAECAKDRFNRCGIAYAFWGAEQ